MSELLGFVSRDQALLIAAFPAQLSGLDHIPNCCSLHAAPALHRLSRHQLNTDQAAFLFNQRPPISTPAVRPLIRPRSRPAQNPLKPPESSVGGLIISAAHPVSSSLASPASGDFTAVGNTHTLAHKHKHICDSVDPRRQIRRASGLGLPDQSDEVIRQNLIFPQIAPLISAVFPATITLTPSPH